MRDREIEIERQGQRETKEASFKVHRKYFKEGRKKKLKIKVET